MWRHGRHVGVPRQKNFKYSFERYTNMAADFFVVLIPRDWVKTLYTVIAVVPGNDVIDRKTLQQTY